MNNNINGYSASGLPPGLTINSEEAIGGVPTTKGTFTVTATASDQEGNQAEDTFEIPAIFQRAKECQSGDAPLAIGLQPGRDNLKNPRDGKAGTVKTSRGSENGG
ncbi:MAG: putative Ig domain-containing protein [Hormoscilla sp. SP5CHS1]|nr:putative Ig domain-containing protein [Hormoscilla sp. SP12CHS1]MBC6454035.1 putative Ig domain-containing protein [Hormoscilla sp. SP5CHS1]